MPGRRRKRTKAPFGRLASGQPRRRPLVPKPVKARNLSIKRAIEGNRRMRTSDRGITLLKGIEKLRLKAYQDGGGKWTIGYGHTGADVYEGKEITEPLAEAILREDLMFTERSVKEFVKVPLTQSMFDALVLFTFNVGKAAFEESKLLVELNKTAYLNVPEQMTRWKWDNGKPVRGLLIRRLTEGLLFLQDGLPENATRAD